jgi:hypothetical protein
MKQDCYKINKTEFTVGDTIIVTIYNKYNYIESYYNYDDSCYFSNRNLNIGIRLNVKGIKCKPANNILQVQPGVSLNYSMIVTRKKKHYFSFSMYSDQECSQGFYHTLHLKFKVSGQSNKTKS